MSYQSHTVKKLKDILSAKKLSKKGKKADLIKRLVDHDNSEKGKSILTQDKAVIDPEGLNTSLNDLRKRSGEKDEIMNRLLKTQKEKDNTDSSESEKLTLQSFRMEYLHDKEQELQRRTAYNKNIHSLVGVLSRHSNEIKEIKASLEELRGLRHSILLSCEQILKNKTPEIV